MESNSILERFWSMPVSSADEVFEIFDELPGAVKGRGTQSLERFVYIPGARKDRVLLVAHADTVWDLAYGNPQENGWLFEDGVYRSSNPKCGIGADDRAGCAMLWALRDCGHSLLIVSGEEKGKRGARFLREHYRKLFRQLNSHCFMMEMDWAGTGGCLYNQVDNTERFKQYIANVLGFQDSKARGGCDLQILCQKVCGVNIGVGWHDCHRPSETLVLTEWESTYHRLVSFLQKPQRRFAIPVSVRLVRFAHRVKGKAGSIFRKFGLLSQKKQ